MDPNTQQPAQPMQPTPQMPPQQAMPTQSAQAQGAQQPPKSNKKLLLFLLLIIVIALIVGAVAYVYVMGSKSINNQAYVAPQPTKAVPTLTPTPEVSVQNSTDLNGAINEVNNTSTSTMESELNQAVTESKNL